MEAATCGVAMLVPLKETKSGPVSQNAYVEVMSTPGAEISGLSRPSAVGPRLLNVAIPSSEREIVFRSSTAPTEKMLNAAPGSFIVQGLEPAFPAAIATATPRPSTTASKNRSHAVSPAHGGYPPKLRLTTSAPAVPTAQSIPVMPSEGTIWPPPPVVSQPAFVLMSWSRPNATPRYTVSELATVPATCVPWLWRSSGFAGLSP